MTKNKSTDLPGNKGITLLQQKIFGWIKNRNLYEAKTEVLYGSITTKSLKLILITLSEIK